MNGNKYAITMAELTVVMIVLAILSAAIVFAGQAVVNSQRRTVVSSDEKLFCSEMQNVFKSAGKLSLSSSTASWTDTDKTTAVNYLSSISQNYVKFSFNPSSIVYKNGGIVVPFKTLNDPWNRSYKLAINTDPSSQYVGTIIMYSLGGSGVDHSATYCTNKMGDNIVAGVVPKF